MCLAQARGARVAQRLCKPRVAPAHLSRLLKLSAERPCHDRSEIMHNAIVKRDTIQHHAAPTSLLVVLPGSVRCFGFRTGRH
jgi:hypothetical protein